jgi:hypothetical protein
MNRPPEIQQKIDEILVLINTEKRKPEPDKKQMREWVREIRELVREDEERTGLYEGTMYNPSWRYQTHTSMRGWPKQPL